MPYITAQIIEAGPVVELLVGITAPRRDLLTKHGMSVPPRLPVKALIDTGSAVTALAPEIIQALDLSVTGQTDIITASTPHPCNAYDISLSLADPDGVEMHLPFLPIIESSFLSTLGIRALLGRDVLAYCLVVYDGQHETFSLAY